MLLIVLSVTPSGDRRRQQRIREPKGEWSCGRHFCGPASDHQGSAARRSQPALATGEEDEAPARKGPSSHPQSHTNRHLLSTCFCLGPFPLNGSHGGLRGPQLSASWGAVGVGAGGDSQDLSSAFPGTLDKPWTKRRP